MQETYAKDGDTGFLGFNSRNNPAILPEGYLAWAENIRLDKGNITARKGVYKYTATQVLNLITIGSGSYLQSDGTEIFVIVANLAAESENSRIYTYTPDLNVFGPIKQLPLRIPNGSDISVTYALNKIFITRGHEQRPIVWDLYDTFTVLPSPVPPSGGGTGHEFPNCTFLAFYMNRLVALGRHHASNDANESRYTVSVSHYLEWDKWDALDAFFVNQGGNDETIGIVPWTMNEFLVLLKNSIYYLNVGTSRYLTGEPLASDAAIYTLATDVGCVARRSAVQVSSGVMFLSDNGVYLLQPNPSGNEGIKLLTLNEPISAPIDNVIKRINKNHVKKASAIYWNNRYYLAVPIDDSTVNNCVLIFNFILKAWESIDTYPAHVNVMDFAIAKKGNQRRLFAIDSVGGVLLMDESYGDSIFREDGQGGSPVLSFYLDQTAVLLEPIPQENYYPPTPYPIAARAITRMYTFGELGEKRYSSISTDIDAAYGGTIETSVLTKNPDTDTLIDVFTSREKKDSTRRPPVRKIAYGIQLEYKTTNMNPSILSNQIMARVVGNKKISTQ